MNGIREWARGDIDSTISLLKELDEALEEEQVLDKSNVEYLHNGIL